MFKLDVQKRDKVGTKASRAFLKAGFIPSTLYGRDVKSVPTLVKKSQFDKIWKEAGESSLISLVGLGEPQSVLIRDVDIDPVADVPRHADFYAVAKGQKVRVWVPVEFEGESPAIRELGGTLVKVIHELEIEADPDKLPHNIVGDLASLTDFDAQITVADLKLPQGVEAMAEDTDVVALVTESKEEELEESTEMDLSKIEVEKKGKEESTDDEEAESGV